MADQLNHTIVGAKIHSSLLRFFKASGKITHPRFDFSYQFYSWNLHRLQPKQLTSQFYLRLGRYSQDLAL